MPGAYISDRDNHKTFNWSWGGYPGEHEFPYAARATVTDRPLEEWRADGVTYAIVAYHDYERLMRTATGQEVLDHMLLLKSYPPSEDFRGPSMVVFRLTPIEHAADGALGPVELVGYDIDRTAVAPGESITFTLYWQAAAALEAEYVVYNHLVPLDSREIAGQIDGPPLVTANRPTTEWDDPDEVLVSRPFTLAIDPAVPPGEYRLVTGFYRRDTGERLQAPSGDDFLVVTEIRVTGPDDSEQAD
jgi:hypothetical protein